MKRIVCALLCALSLVAPVIARSQHAAGKFPNTPASNYLSLGYLHGGPVLFYRGNQTPGMFFPKTVNSGIWDTSSVSNLLPNNVAGEVVADPSPGAYVDTARLYYRGTNGYLWMVNLTPVTNQQAYTATLMQLPVQLQGDPFIQASGGRVYFRDLNNRLGFGYWSGTSWLSGLMGAQNNVAGDIGIAGNGQVFYRGTDNRLYSWWWGNNQWNYTWMGPQNNIQGSVAVAPNGQVFYRGTDNRMYTWWWGNNQWNYTWMGSQQDVFGPITVAIINNGWYTRLCYPATTQAYVGEYTWINQWLWTETTGSAAPMAGNSVILPNGQVLWHGTDGYLWAW